MNCKQHAHCTGRKLPGGDGDNARKRATPPSKAAASQVCGDDACCCSACPMVRTDTVHCTQSLGPSSLSCASEQTGMPASKRVCTEQARSSAAQSRPVTSVAEDHREGADSGLSESAAFHSVLPAMPAGCTQVRLVGVSCWQLEACSALKRLTVLQEAPDLAGWTMAQPTSAGLPRIVSAPCILLSESCSSEAAQQQERCGLRGEAQDDPSSNSSGSGATQHISAVAGPSASSAASLQG